MPSTRELEQRVEWLEEAVKRAGLRLNRERKILAKAREIITTHETRIDTLQTQGLALRDRVAALEAL